MSHLYRSDDDLSPAPVLLNCWKHHAGVIRERISALVGAGEAGLRSLPSALLVIGTSQMDIYTGDLMPAQVAQSVLAMLTAVDRLDADRFQTWLMDQRGYGVTTVEDGSTWVLRAGIDPERYVHLHPGRGSLQTLRLHAPVLKSAITALVWTGVHGGDPFDVAILNRARQAVLGLSPVKAIKRSEGIGATIALLASSDEHC